MSAKIVEPCSIRLRKALSARNMRQADLAEITKIPKSAISHYLRGSFVPKQDRAFIIAQALDVSPAWIMGYDVPMEPEEAQPTQQKSSPSEVQLTEGEKVLLDLFNRVPKEQQQLVLQMIRAALGSQE